MQFSAESVRDSAPQYELRIRRHGAADTEYVIWQMPSRATPQITSTVRIAGLRGRNLDLIEHRVLQRLTREGLKPAKLGGQQQECDCRLTEDLALNLGLLFRSLAPMRDRNKIRAVAEGIEAMQREEAAYWLGMAMHRKRPRRILMALRTLLTEPRSR